MLRRLDFPEHDQPDQEHEPDPAHADALVAGQPCQQADNSGAHPDRYRAGNRVKPEELANPLARRDMHQHVAARRDRRDDYDGGGDDEQEVDDI